MYDCGSKCFGVYMFLAMTATWPFGIITAAKAVRL